VATPELSRAVPLPPPSRRVSILPAASVLGLAVFTLVIFSVMNAFDSSTVAPTTAPVIVGGLQPASAATDSALFSKAVQDGVPPVDIASALIAPRGAVWLHNLNTGGQALGGYDRATSLSVAAPSSRLFGFYRSHLQALGWTQYSAGAAPGGGDELLFQKGGSDGWYWEAGVIARAITSGKTTFTLRLFQAAESS
jgi:hypothetical protein